MRGDDGSVLIAKAHGHVYQLALQRAIVLQELLLRLGIEVEEVLVDKPDYVLDVLFDAILPKFSNIRKRN